MQFRQTGLSLKSRLDAFASESEIPGTTADTTAVHKQVKHCRRDIWTWETCFNKKGTLYINLSRTLRIMNRLLRASLEVTSAIIWKQNRTLLMEQTIPTIKICNLAINDDTSYKCKTIYSINYITIILFWELYLSSIFAEKGVRLYWWGYPLATDPSQLGYLDSSLFHSLFYFIFLERTLLRLSTLKNWPNCFGEIIHQLFAFSNSLQRHFSWSAVPKFGATPTHKTQTSRNLNATSWH